MIVVHRAAAQRRRQHRHDVHRAASPTPSARATADEIIAPPAAQARAGPGHHAVPAGGAGRAHRRPRSRTQYQYTLQDADLDELRDLGAAACSSALRKLPELRDVATDQQTAGLQLDVDIDRDTAARLGITPQADRRHALRRLRPAPGRDDVHRSSTSTASCWRRRPSSAGSPDSCSQRLRARRRRRAGAAVERRASSTPAPTPLSINHQGQFPAVTLSFNLAPGRRARPGGRRDRRAPSAQIGLPASVRASFQGTAQAFRPRSASEPLLILAALFAVYIVLGMLYESLIHPITILSTLPSAARRRAARAAAVRASSFSIIALIGIILLHRHREEERDHDDRLRARGRARARASTPTRRSTRPACCASGPILMTTLAALSARCRWRSAAAPAPSCAARWASPSSAGSASRSSSTCSRRRSSTSTSIACDGSPPPPRAPRVIQYPKGLFGGGVAPGAPDPGARRRPTGRGCDGRRRHGGPARRKRLSRRTGAAGRHRRSNRDVGRPRKRRRRRLRDGRRRRERRHRHGGRRDAYRVRGRPDRRHWRRRRAPERGRRARGGYSGRRWHVARL